MQKYVLDLEIVRGRWEVYPFSCCRLHKTKFIAVTQYKNNKVHLYVYKLVDRTIGLSLRWTCLNVVFTVNIIIIMCCFFPVQVILNENPLANGRRK